MGLMFLEACSGGGGGGSGGGGSSPQMTVSISPRPLAVQKGTSNTLFTAKDSSNQLIPQSSMTWSVDGTGINGSFDPNVKGLYIAPASVPPQNPVTVRTALVSDPSKNDAVSFYILTGPNLSFLPSFDVTGTFNLTKNNSSLRISVMNSNTYLTWVTTDQSNVTHLWYSQGDKSGVFSLAHDIIPDIQSYIQGTGFPNPENPAIVVDSLENVYIAWDDNASGVYQIYAAKGPHATICGTTTAPCFTPFALTGTGNATSLQVFPGPPLTISQQNPSLTMTPFGKLEFAWTEGYQGTPSPSRLITYGELDSNGVLTKGPMQVTPSRTPNTQTNPAIEIDISGNVSISWIDRFWESSTSPNIFYSRLQSGQSVFDPEMQVERDVLSPTAIFSMALDNSGQPHLVWSKTSELNATTGIYYATIANFTSPVKLTIDGTNGYHPAIKVDLLNYLYLSWDDGLTTFFKKTDASPAQGSLVYPQWQISGVNSVMNIDDGGRVYLLYSTTGGSNPSTFYVKGE